MGDGDATTDKADRLALGDPASDSFDPQNYLFLVLAHAHHLYGDRIAHALRSTGTDRSRWRVLMALSRQTSASIKHLTEVTNINQSTVSKIIDRMRRDGWLTTGPRASDSRFTDVELSPSGREVLDKLVRIASHEYHAALDGVEASDLECTLRTLHNVIENLRRY